MHFTYVLDARRKNCNIMLIRMSSTWNWGIQFQIRRNYKRKLHNWQHFSVVWQTDTYAPGCQINTHTHLRKKNDLYSNGNSSKDDLLLATLLHSCHSFLFVMPFFSSHIGAHMHTHTVRMYFLMDYADDDLLFWVAL